MVASREERRPGKGRDGAILDDAGAGGPEHAPVRLHASVAGGHLGMDAYAFGADARALADEVAAVAAK